MKVLILILSFFLSVVSGSKMDNFGQCESCYSTIAEYAGHSNPDNDPNYYPQAVLPAQSARFSGEESSVTPSVRSNSSGRRIQVLQKFPFRIIKAGKIIDRYHFLVFQIEVHQFQSGIHSTSRYIHSICRLLI